MWLERSLIHFVCKNGIADTIICSILLQKKKKKSSTNISLLKPSRNNLA